MAVSDGGEWSVQILKFPWRVAANATEIVFEGKVRIAVQVTDLIGAVRAEREVSVCYFNPIQRAFKFLDILCESPVQSGEIEDYVQRVANVGLQARRIAVLVNPVGGRKRGRRYWALLIEPILRYSQCEYQLFETNSAEFVERFSRELNVEEFTDVVCVGGDGLIHQVINGFAQRPDAERALSLRFGVVPAGTQNALACAIGCKNPVLSLFHILKLHSFPGRLLCISLDSSPTPVLSCCGLAWGVVSTLAKRAQHLRKFGAAVILHPAIRHLCTRTAVIPMEEVHWAS